MQNNNEKIVFYKRISFKFVLFVFISTVFVFFLSAIWQIKEISDQRINDLHNRAKLLTSIQAGALSTPLWNLEELAIKNTLQSLSDDPDFTSAIIVDEKGKEKFFHGLRETEKTYSVTSHITYSGDLIGDIVLNFSLKNIEKDKKELAFNIFIQSSISMITMLISCFFCLQMIISPLKKLRLAMIDLAAGKMDIDTVLSQRPDELGSIARAVENFKINLIEEEKRRAFDANKTQQKHSDDQKNLINKLAHDFEMQLGDIVNSVSSAATELNANAENLTTTSDNTAAQAVEVTAASQNALTTVQNVSDLSNGLLESITQIGHKILQSSHMTQQAVATANNTKETISELMTMANNIGGVIRLIQDIAEQTNLLALNATIEAARAGEAGRGFVVVAQEVKLLASQTAKATSTISEQVKSIQGATNDAVEAIRQISQTIEQINDISIAMTEAVRLQTESTSDITYGINSIATTSNQIKQNIGFVAENADHSRQYSRDVLDAASDLAQKSELLRRLMHDFVGSLRT